MLTRWPGVVLNQRLISTDTLPHEFAFASKQASELCHVRVNSSIKGWSALPARWTEAPRLCRVTCHRIPKQTCQGKARSQSSRMAMYAEWSTFDAKCLLRRRWRLCPLLLGEVWLRIRQAFPGACRQVPHAGQFWETPCGTEDNGVDDDTPPSYLPMNHSSLSVRHHANSSCCWPCLL